MRELRVARQEQTTGDRTTCVGPLLMLVPRATSRIGAGRVKSESEKPMSSLSGGGADRRVVGGGVTDYGEALEDQGLRVGEVLHLPVLPWNIE